MEQETERIERHIEARREQLGRNLDELETRVKSVFDWRHQFDRNPWLIMGMAFGGGLALTSLAGRSRGYAGNRYPSGGDGNLRTGYSSPTTSRLADTWHNIQEALLAAATAKAEQFLEEVVPGFGGHYHTSGRMRKGDFGRNRAEDPSEFL